MLRYRTTEPFNSANDQRTAAATAGNEQGREERLTALVHSHRHQLRRAFEQQAAAGGSGSGGGHKGRVSVEGWAAAMGEVLRLKGVDWLALQPILAPAIQRLVVRPGGGGGDGSQQLNELHSTGQVRYDRFLEAYLQELKLEAPKMDGGDDGSHGTAGGAAPSNSVLGAVYGFTVDVREAEQLFDEMDTDGDGQISLQEFGSAWDRLGLPQGDAGQGDAGQGDAGQGLAGQPSPVGRVFAAMDIGNTGSISRNEFFEVMRISAL